MMIYMLPTRILYLFTCCIHFAFSLSCSTQHKWENQDITQTILTDTSNFFYLDSRNYPENGPSLPIGIFDSGTGGLAVLEVILNLDKFDNRTHQFIATGDGLPDFREEYFLFLADQANMPYGNYSRENNIGLLKEHIIKDAQFLLGRKYYQSARSKAAETNKEPVKILTIACNTATAIGKQDIENLLARADLDLKVIGIIDAGSKAALNQFRQDESGTIAVMATAGTVASGGYVKTIRKQQNDLGYQGTISIYQQAGIGLAGAIDGAAEFIDPSATKPREGYQGPVENHPGLSIDLSILPRYGFQWTPNHMLFAGDSLAPKNIQINSVENYISYHLVTLLENIRSEPDAEKLKAILLACTHYPFYEKFFEKKLTWLRDYQENDQYIYRPYLAENVVFIDPAEDMAIELYQTLRQSNLFNQSDLSRSEFYISIPNTTNPGVQVDVSGHFTYEYKYGREKGHIQEYVKRVLMIRRNISKEAQRRLEQTVPNSFELLREFNRNNSKLRGISEEDRF
jgi:glutamate racemase